MKNKINNTDNPIRRKNQKIFNLKAEKLVREASDNFIYLKDYKKALQQIEEAIAEDPKHTKALLMKGDILLCTEKDEEALSAYEEAIKSNTSCAQAYGSKAGVLDMMGRQEEALECCKKAFDYMNLNDKQLLLSLYDQKISILSTLKMFANAKEALAQAIENLPEEDGKYLFSCYGDFINGKDKKDIEKLFLKLVY